MMQQVPLDIKEFPEEISSSLGHIHQLIFPPQGDTSVVAIADTTHGKYVVKRSHGEQFSSYLKQEYKVLGELAQSPFSMPRPLAFVQREAGKELESWLVMSYLPGEPLIVAIDNEVHQDRRLSILRAFGSVLATIHSHPVPAELQSSSCLERAEYNFLHYTTEGSAKLLAQLKQYRPLPIQPTLMHGDFTVDNVLIVEGKVTGIIDWAGGGMGDPRYDVALAIRPRKTGLFHTLQDRQAFFEGYDLSDLSKFDYEYFINLYEFF